MDYLYSDLTEQIILTYYRVFNFFRAHPGYDEASLRDALKIELAQRGLTVVTEFTSPRTYAGHAIGEGRIDAVVEGKVALELKRTARIDTEAIEQMDTYLRDARLAVGLILKFHRAGPAIKRRFNKFAVPGGVR
jgi:GxxExxY protein